MTTVSLMLLSCLMLQSQIQGKDALIEQPIPFTSCPLSAHNWHSACFAMYITRQSWYEAEVICQKWPSGHLASVLSSFEADSVSFLVNNSGGIYDYVWIGLHFPTLQMESSGDELWKWSNNDEMQFLNWERDPNLASDHGYCGCLTEISGYYKWRDCHCDMLLPYVCKYTY